jgi:hypothetical protein
MTSSIRDLVSKTTLIEKIRTSRKAALVRDSGKAQSFRCGLSWRPLRLGVIAFFDGFHPQRIASPNGCIHTIGRFKKRMA